MCDADLDIMDIVTGYPGTTHDQRILAKSHLGMALTASAGPYAHAIPQRGCTLARRARCPPLRGGRQWLCYSCVPSHPSHWHQAHQLHGDFQSALLWGLCLHRALFWCAAGTVGHSVCPYALQPMHRLTYLHVLLYSSQLLPVIQLHNHSCPL